MLSFDNEVPSHHKLLAFLDKITLLFNLFSSDTKLKPNMFMQSVQQLNQSIYFADGFLH